MSIEDFIIYVHCLVDEELNQILTKPLRSRGFSPKLSDTEVITMDVGEFLGKDTDTSIWQYFFTHWLALFPHLGSQVNYTRQFANLWNIKQIMQMALAHRMGALSDKLHLTDGLPIPVCHFKRAYFSPIFEGAAA